MIHEKKSCYIEGSLGGALGFSRFLHFAFIQTQWCLTLGTFLVNG